MELKDAILGRRSIRKYRADDVPDEVIMHAIDLARHAPSAGNLQPWEFVIVRDSQVKEKLYEASYQQAHVINAPVLIVVCADLHRASYYGERGETLYAIQDTAAAIQNMLLAFYASGYGTCWVGAFQENLTKETLNLPPHIRPVAIITVGKSKEEPGKRLLKPVEEIVHRERFSLRGYKSP